MKITGPGAPRTVRPRSSRAARGAGGTDFSGHLTDDAASATRSAGAAPVGAVGALLAVQEVPDALDGRSRGLARGNDLLDRLDDLRHALLIGAIPRQSLLALRRLIAERRASGGDAGLSAILDEIELRAEVELAKLDRDR